jgi:hypothetical protein
VSYQTEFTTSISPYFHADPFRVAANQQVNSGIRDPTIFNGQFIKIGGKRRIRESNRSFRGPDRNCQRRSEQQKNASGRPCLRGTTK